MSLQASLWGDRRALWVLPDVLYGKYRPGPRALFAHLFGSSWHGEDVHSALWLLRHPLVLGLLICMAAAAGAHRLWRSCSRAPRSGAGGSAPGDGAAAAALKMC